jgi:nitrate/nitrite-specific signal transduction histidine kinase
MADKRNARRKLVVNPRFQMKFALILVLLHVNVGFLYQIVLHQRVQNLAREAGSIDAFLALDPWSAIWPAMLMAGLISSVAVFFIGIRYSHQIVGPLPRVSRALRQISQGEQPERLQFRPGDVLEHLAAQVNRVADVARIQSESRQETEPRQEPKVDPASILGEQVRREPVGF